jgi:hypothetical protein
MKLGRLIRLSWPATASSVSYVGQASAIQRLI